MCYQRLNHGAAGRMLTGMASSSENSNAAPVSASVLGRRCMIWPRTGRESLERDTQVASHDMARPDEVALPEWVVQAQSSLSMRAFFGLCAGIEFQPDDGTAGHQIGDAEAEDGDPDRTMESI